MYIKEHLEHINNIQSQLDQDVQVGRHQTQPRRDAQFFCRNLQVQACG